MWWPPLRHFSILHSKRFICKHVIFYISGVSSAPLVEARNGATQNTTVGMPYEIVFTVHPPLPPENVTLEFTTLTQTITITDGQSSILYMEVSPDHLSVMLNPAIPSHQGSYILTAMSVNGTNSATIHLEILCEMEMASFIAALLWAWSK